MKILILLLSLAFSPMTLTINDYSGEYAGTWVYSINTPDGTIKGQMVLTFEDGEYAGKITAYGQEYQMTEVEHEGNELNFKSNAAGYSSTIKGKFDGDTYTATISVEGMQIPLVATKEG